MFLEFADELDFNSLSRSLNLIDLPIIIFTWNHISYEIFNKINSMYKHNIYFLW